MVNVGVIFKMLKFGFLIQGQHFVSESCRCPGM